MCMRVSNLGAFCWVPILRTEICWGLCSVPLSVSAIILAPQGNFQAQFWATSGTFLKRWPHSDAFPGENLRNTTKSDAPQKGALVRPRFFSEVDIKASMCF